MADPKDLKILFFGAGAIGGSVCAWVSAHHPQTYLFARGEAADVIREKGLTLYQGDAPAQKQRFPINLIDDLSDLPDADVVVIAVKLYHLEHAAQTIHEKLGDRPLIVGMQNGVESQTILPKYFSRVVYCQVTYNAWIDAPGVIGYQNKGPLTLGTPDNRLQAEMEQLVTVFSSGVETAVTRRLQDAAHCKLIINLGKSVTTLIARPEEGDAAGLDLYQKILANTLYEGVRVVRAAGYREEHLGRTPSWRTIQLLAKLPPFLTRPVFRRNLKKLNMSSMGQDVLVRKSSDTELEYLNGYLLSLAERCRVDAPYNRVIYRLCKEYFAIPGFQPLDSRLV